MSVRAYYVGTIVSTFVIYIGKNSDRKKMNLRFDTFTTIATAIIIQHFVLIVHVYSSTKIKRM